MGTAAAITRRDTKDELAFQSTLQSLNNIKQDIHRAREMSISDKSLIVSSPYLLDRPLTEFSSIERTYFTNVKRLKAVPLDR